MDCRCNADDNDFIDPSTYIARVNKCIRIVQKALFCQEDCLSMDNDTFANIVTEVRYHLLKAIIDMQPKVDKFPTTMKSKDDVEREMFCLSYEAEQDKEKTNNIRGEWRIQQKRMAELQEEIFKMNRQLSLYSEYAASQGSVFAGILSKTLTENGVLSTLMREEGFLKFICITESCLQSFARSHSYKLPMNDDPTYKYTLALCTSTVNISKKSKGRVYFLQHNDSRRLLKTFIRLVPFIECPTGETIKLAMLETLNNMTKDQEGLIFFQAIAGIENVFNNCLNRPHSTDIVLKTTEFLYNLTRHVDENSQDFFENIQKTICHGKLIALLERSVDKDIKIFAGKILKNLEKARAYFIALEKEREREAQRKAGEQERNQANKLEICSCKPDSQPKPATQPKRKTKTTHKSPKASKMKTSKPKPKKPNQKKVSKRKSSPCSCIEYEETQTSVSASSTAASSASSSTKDKFRTKPKVKKSQSDTECICSKDSEKDYRGVLSQPSLIANEASPKSPKDKHRSKPKKPSSRSVSTSCSPKSKKSSKSGKKLDEEPSVISCTNIYRIYDVPSSASIIARISMKVNKDGTMSDNDSQKSENSCVCSLKESSSKSQIEKQEDVKKETPSEISCTCSLPTAENPIENKASETSCTCSLLTVIEKPAEKNASETAEKPIEKKPSETSCTCSLPTEIEKPAEKKASETAEKPIEKKPSDKSCTCSLLTTENPTEKRSAEKKSSEMNCTGSSPNAQEPMETKPSEASCTCSLKWSDIRLPTNEPEKKPKEKKASACGCSEDDVRVSKALVDIRAPEKSPNKPFVPACSEYSKSNNALEDSSSVTMHTCLSTLSAVCSCTEKPPETVSQTCAAEKKKGSSQQALVPVDSDKMRSCVKCSRSRIPTRVWTTSNLPSSSPGARQKVTTRYKIPQFKKQFNEDCKK